MEQPPNETIRLLDRILAAISSIRIPADRTSGGLSQLIP